MKITSSKHRGHDPLIPKGTSGHLSVVACALLSQRRNEQRDHSVLCRERENVTFFLN